MERRKLQGVSSNGYLQIKEELEWGVRFAWRNSRKCIMRAHWWDLKCVDLRDIKTSKGMVDAIINHAAAAYNEGRIVPTGKFLARLQATKLTYGQHSSSLKGVLTALDLCSGHISS